MKCAICNDKDCYNGKDCTNLKQKVEDAYSVEDIKQMKISAKIEAEHYMKKTRLEELILFAENMGYQRIGLAFCIGLESEAKIIHEILDKKFEIHSVCCKICGIDKSKFELKSLHPNKEIDAMCNPIGQAQVLNQENTDLNIILGLCIGHDILFSKYSKAPVTVLAVKDRVLAHNPLGAIYSKYYLEKVFNISDKE